MDCDFAGYVVSGNIVIEIDHQDPVHLSCGDAFHVPRGIPLRGYCEQGERARLLTILYPIGKNSEDDSSEIEK